jgi:hypothetical protein
MNTISQNIMKQFFVPARAFVKASLISVKKVMSCSPWGENFLVTHFFIDGSSLLFEVTHDSNVFSVTDSEDR